MKLTKRWLKNRGACKDAYQWYLKQETENVEELFSRAMEEKRYSDINWVLSQKLERLDKIRYAVYAAELVIDIWEKQNKDDRKAIEAAKAYIKNPSKKNRDAAYEAANVANKASAGKVYTAYAVACAAVFSAFSASYAVAGATFSASYAVSCAARAASYTNYEKILNYGYKLLIKRKNENNKQVKS